MQTKTKTIAMILVIAIATIGAIGIGIGTSIQPVKGHCQYGHPDCDDSHGQSSHDVNGDTHSGHA